MKTWPKPVLVSFLLAFTLPGWSQTLDLRMMRQVLCLCAWPRFPGINNFYNKNLLENFHFFINFFLKQTTFQKKCQNKMLLQRRHDTRCNDIQQNDISQNDILHQLFTISIMTLSIMPCTRMTTRNVLIYDTKHKRYWA